MSVFSDFDQIRDAVRGILLKAHDVNTAKNWIRALPGPSSVCSGVGGAVTDDLPGVRRGIRFDILGGDIVVRFNDDGTREAMFTIATQHDDPNPQLISVRCASPPSDLLSPEQALAARRVLFG